jgi:Dihaem cytochrome c
MLQFMSQFFRRRSRLTLIMLFLSTCLGLALAQGMQPATAQSVVVESPSQATIGTVDPVPAKYQPGQDRYLKTCATCHIALPPAVLPSQTWADLIGDPQHYGAQLPTLGRFEQAQISQYLNHYSRSLRQDEPTPYRVSQARHFRALHPQVKLPQPLTIASCASCHPKADVFNFREWQEVGN